MILSPFGDNPGSRGSTMFYSVGKWVSATGRAILACPVTPCSLRTLSRPMQVVAEGT
jgi:hypothetical protein